MTTPLQRRAQSQDQQHRKAAESRLWQLWQRLLRRAPTDTRSSPQPATDPPKSPITAPGRHMPVETVRQAREALDRGLEWREGSSQGHDAWVRPVLLLVCMALNTAPTRRDHWTVRLRLREDLLPQCSLTLGLSPVSVQLRFRSCDDHTLSLVLADTESVRRVLQELTGRSVEIDVVNEYFGFA